MFYSSGFGRALPVDVGEILHTPFGFGSAREGVRRMDGCRSAGRTLIDDDVTTKRERERASLCVK